MSAGATSWGLSTRLSVSGEPSSDTLYFEAMKRMHAAASSATGAGGGGSDAGSTSSGGWKSPLPFGPFDPFDPFWCEPLTGGALARASHRGKDFEESASVLRGSGLA